jgi:hypothetical protein
MAGTGPYPSFSLSLASSGTRQVEDKQDGTYRCTYVTSKAGLYQISVTLNGAVVYVLFIVFMMFDVWLLRRTVKHVSTIM